MARQTDGTDWIEHVGPTSEVEPPETTVGRLFGPDPDEARLTESFRSRDVTITAADYFREEETRHEVHVGDRVEDVPCVADALEVAALLDHVPVRVHSTAPVSDGVVRFEVTDDDLVVDPESHVVSVGSARALVEGLPDEVEVMIVTADVLTGEDRWTRSSAQPAGEPESSACPVGAEDSVAGSAGRKRGCGARYAVRSGS